MGNTYYFRAPSRYAPETDAWIAALTTDEINPYPDGLDALIRWFKGKNRLNTLAMSMSPGIGYVRPVGQNGIRQFLSYPRSGDGTTPDGTGAATVDPTADGGGGAFLGANFLTTFGASIPTAATLVIRAQKDPAANSPGTYRGLAFAGVAQVQEAGAFVEGDTRLFVTTDNLVAAEFPSPAGYFDLVIRYSAGGDTATLNGVALPVGTGTALLNFLTLGAGSLSTLGWGEAGAIAKAALVTGPHLTDSEAAELLALL